MSLPKISAYGYRQVEAATKCAPSTDPIHQYEPMTGRDPIFGCDRPVHNKLACNQEKMPAQELPETPLNLLLSNTQRLLGDQDDVLAGLTGDLLPLLRSAHSIDGCCAEKEPERSELEIVIAAINSRIAENTAQIWRLRGGLCLNSKL